jgi:hypothetical protein
LEPCHVIAVKIKLIDKEILCIRIDNHQEKPKIRSKIFKVSVLLKLNFKQAQLFVGRDSTGVE